jgi:uridylate kinase
MNKSNYNRILLKLSGEALMGTSTHGICPKTSLNIVNEIKKLIDQKIQIAIVIGGGNIFRGVSLSEQGIDRATGDYMGMLATVMNSLALQDIFESNGIKTRIQSAVNIEQFVEPYVRAKSLQYLSEGKVVIFSGGTGNPFFTTDTAAALRAKEIDADILIKATKVDGVYTDDPQKNSAAIKIDKIVFDDVLKKNLKVMDATAFTICREQNIPIGILNIFEKDSLYTFLKNYTSGSLITN